MNNFSLLAPFLFLMIAAMVTVQIGPSQVRQETNLKSDKARRTRTRD